jgi:glycosyltransferase involved in cell wall biosynthesis
MSLKYSVVISYCCQRKKELQELLNSVRNQTIAPDEIIVVTDGPSPELSDIDVILIESQKVGQPGPLRNKGIKKAKNNYIFISDDDDIWHPQKAERQLNCLNRSNSFLCFTMKQDFFQMPYNFDIFNSRPVFKFISFRNLLVRNSLVLSSCLVRFESSGEKTNFSFNESKDVRGWEDFYTWLCHSREKRRIVVVKERLLFYRIHNGSMRNGKFIEMFENQKKIVSDDFSLNTLEKIIFNVLSDFRIFKWRIASKNYFE